MSKFKGKKILIAGLGKSGVSAAKYLSNQGAKLTISDVKSKMDLASELRSLGDLKAEFEFGKHNPKTFSSQDLIILSPGVPSDSEAVNEARAAGVPIVNDIELVSQLVKAPIIAITGSNGKTTTTCLISEMLKNSGKKVHTGGNIGTPAFDLLANPETPDWYVFEVSSFQLESIDKFKPTIAVVTNLEPNHLDRYPTGLDSYYNAKKNILKNADKTTVLVNNFDNEASKAFLLAGFLGKNLSFTKKNPIKTDPAGSEKFLGAYLNGPRMVLKINSADEVYELLGCKLVGEHNRENLMASALAARQAGATKEGIQKTIETFKGVSHRLEHVRKKDGVTFYNDSKATSVGALKRALESVSGPVILISGGRDKDQDFSPVTDLVKRKVKNLILIGEAKEKINRSIGDYSETFLVGTFEEAVLLAYQKSRNGDVILLSPACASYDMFKSYEERGDYFKKLVTQL
ncbi:MAG: UDP-N-acetylmuramoyl-L-alanine--D-glutamate ligase [Bacteriovoracia bacterium]